MNILISDNWLREYINTKASVEDISKYLSLSAFEVERIIKTKSDYIYDIEITTNRVDAMSIYGIARELAAVLPRFDIPAKLKPVSEYKAAIPKKGYKLILKSDPKLTYRLMGVVLEDIKTKDTPKWMKERLESAGLRSLNSVVDITNYLTHEIGHPCHVFDYDKLPNKKIVVRESKSGETYTSFDNKNYKLDGGDIVFDDGDGNIIDLPGIIGAKNSVVSKNTKRVLFFFDTNEASRIRKTSMSLAIRTVAATLNEKSVDPELAEIALKRGLELFRSVCKAKVASPIYDIYHNPHKPQTIKISEDFIIKSIGVEIAKTDISNYLNSLEFKSKWVKNILEVQVPSSRSKDVLTKIDVVEEIARIYGYHNLPSKLMAGELPIYKANKDLLSERKVRNILTKLNATEVYTFSLVSENMVGKSALKLRNPLGSDTEYLRDNLFNSLKEAAQDNLTVSEKYHIFEITNIYLKQKSELPNESLTLGGIFSGYEYFEAKGIVQALLNSLYIKYSQKQASLEKFNSDTSVSFKHNDKTILEFGILKNTDFLYYQADMSIILELMKNYPEFTPIPTFPPQIEDMTIKISNSEKVGEIFDNLKNSHKNISQVELVDSFKQNYTFRIWYQNSKKTLTDKEVEKIRSEIVKKLGVEDRIQ